MWHSAARPPRPDLGGPDSHPDLDVWRFPPYRGDGATAACLTPDQKVGSSNLSGLSRCTACFSRLRSAVAMLSPKAIHRGGRHRLLRAGTPQYVPFRSCRRVGPLARAGQQGLWRNGSAPDSRSEGWEFEYLWPQSMHRMPQQAALSGRYVVAEGYPPWWLPSPAPSCDAPVRALPQLRDRAACSGWPAAAMAQRQCV